MLDPSRWGYCGHCRRPKITCPACDNDSCTGGGCDVCHDDFAEAIEMVADGTAPWPCPEERARIEKAYDDEMEAFWFQGTIITS